MADTVCFLLRQHDEVALRAGDGGVDTVVADVFWGPRWAWELAHELDEVEDWPDSVGGGAALDADGRVLTLFDGGPLGEAPLVAGAWSLLAALWGVFGWQVRWAHRGEEELAAAVGLAPPVPPVSEPAFPGEAAVAAALAGLLPLLAEKHPPTHGRLREPMLSALARAGVGAVDKPDGSVRLVHGAGHGDHVPLAELLVAVAVAGARGRLPPLLLDDPVVVPDGDGDDDEPVIEDVAAVDADWVEHPGDLIAAVAAANGVSLEVATEEVVEALVIALCERLGVRDVRVNLQPDGALRAEVEDAAGKVSADLGPVALRAVDLLRDAMIRVPGTRKV